MLEEHKLYLNKIKLVKYKIAKKIKKRKLYKKVQGLYRRGGRIKVIRGPFKGMIYPDFVSAGSVLYPKLSGVYEKELQPVFNKIKSKKYKYIFDIGCAEGYYAIGLKRAIPEAEIYAFDIDARARKLCSNMAKINGVEINIEGECCVERLKVMDFSGEIPSLIISDCEGAERELFTKDVVSNLKNCECLIEVHDWLQYDTPTLDKLIKDFGDTHDHILIFGIDDYEKVYRYHVDEFEKMSLEEKFMIMAEYRKRLGEWIYFTPKSGQNHA